jgi:hypothetical protein
MPHAAKVSMRGWFIVFGFWFLVEVGGWKLELMKPDNILQNPKSEF